MPQLFPLPPEPLAFLGAADRIDGAGTGLVLLRARYDETVFSPHLFSEHGISRPIALAKARDRRLAEFLAGRMLAAQAMAALGLPRETVASAPDRRPLFPHGLSGSISHARGFVACLVTRGANPGVDIETHLTGEAFTAVEKSVLTHNDKIILGSLDPVLVTAVFSAKETLFKALYPTVRGVFGFEAATLVAPPGSASLKLGLTETLGPGFPAGHCFDIQFMLAPDHVLTWATHAGPMGSGTA